MNQLDDLPSLPKLPFIIADAALLTIAVLLAALAPSPLTGATVAAILACAILGAILLAIPFIADYSRRQDAALDERARQLRQLAQLLANTADQISIAATGIDEQRTNTAQLGKLLEQLPGKFPKTPPPPPAIDSEKIARQAADETVRQLQKILESRQNADLEQIKASIEKLSEQTAVLTQTVTLITANTDPRISQQTAVPEPAPKPKKSKSKPAPESDMEAPKPMDAAQSHDMEAPLDDAHPDDTQPPPESETPPQTLEEPPPSEPEHIFQNEDDEAPAIFDNLDKPPSTDTTQPRDVGASLDDARSDDIQPPPEPETPPQTLEEPPPIKETPPEKSPKSTRAKKARTSEPTLEMDLGLPDQQEEPLQSEKSLSSDGATRLIATAYIGIGNKLFIRGEGPGLSWDKGVPLNFVSIGKWNWETSDASEPIRAKLYKNDQIECTALGEITLDPAHQHEMTVRF